MLKEVESLKNLFKNAETANCVKETFLTMIDYALFLPLLINGFALLLCEIHAYWIEKYNDNKEITWDKDKMEEYTKE